MHPKQIFTVKTGVQAGQRKIMLSGQTMTSVTTFFKQAMHWLFPLWTQLPHASFTWSLTLTAELLLHHPHRGVQQERWVIGLCEHWGSKGLSSGGLQPRSCWIGHYVSKTTSAEVTANNIPEKEAKLWLLEFRRVACTEHVYCQLASILFLA